MQVLFLARAAKADKLQAMGQSLETNKRVCAFEGYAACSLLDPVNTHLTSLAKLRSKSLAITISTLTFSSPQKNHYTH